METPTSCTLWWVAKQPAGAWQGCGMAAGAALACRGLLLAGAAVMHLLLSLHMVACSPRVKAAVHTPAGGNAATTH